MLKIIITVYLIIGLTLETIVNGKNTIAAIKNKEEPICVVVIGTIFLTFAAPVIVVYTIITETINQLRNAK